MEKQKEETKQTIIQFEDGIYGFEEIKEFLLLQEDTDGSIWSLQAAHGGVPSIFVMDPFLFVEEYSPRLSDADMEYFGEPNMEDLCFLTVAVLKDNIEESTINLKSPMVIHVKSKKGRQVILENSEYPIRYKPFVEKE